MLGGRVAALQEPRPAVHVHQTLVVVIVDGWAQHSQLELLGAGVVDILQGERNNQKAKPCLQTKVYSANKVKEVQRLND